MVEYKRSKRAYFFLIFIAIIGAVFILSYFTSFSLPEILYLVSGVSLVAGLGYEMAGIPGMVLGLGLLLAIWITIFSVIKRYWINAPRK